MAKTKGDTNTQTRILRAAREEFIATGFRDASLRTIARESNVAVSNIYNYFQHKDSLFRAVLHPLLEALESILGSHNSEQNMDDYMFRPDQYREEILKEFVSLADKYRTDLKLLFIQSGGSSLEHFKEHIIEKQSRIGEEYIKIFKKKYPKANAHISPLFIRINAIGWVNFIIEITANDNLSMDEIEQAISDYISFGTAGWKELMQI